MTESPTRRRFEQIVARDPAQLDLSEAALLIAAEEYPSLDIGGYLHRIEEMGEKARATTQPGAPTEKKIAALNRYLFAHEGFRGNAAEYYDPRNSFLNDVLDRKTGIPISLSALYIEIGRRCGLDLVGVSFPGHFLVKAFEDDDAIVVDPFHGGLLLSLEDCQRRLDRVYAGKVKLEASMLSGVSSHEILSRMLRNLKTIYLKTDDHQRALRVLDLMLLLAPRSAEDYRDRGLVYAALDCYAGAAADLERYLALQPKAVEAEKIKGKVAELKRRAALLN